ncbi:hypothetical protein HG537_0C02780 [Torulaspora globosa]|uniref:Uncharacterized protein n=1 Tax=Torulaspora globosa TaxID=48254 RepID=A0A7H9HQT2_9SACH|nr:hypothetical protein HG537_0C02780 [Torulaspora sp. CBS 2947]
MKAPGVISRNALRQAIQGCVTILAIYIIIKHFLAHEQPFRWFNRVSTRPVQQETHTVQDSSRKIISEPVFDIEDANPIDTTRLAYFLLLCCAFVVLFL